MDVFLIAGEPSGDVIGEKLIQSLNTRQPDSTFYGVGGPRMQTAGMEILLPLQEVTVMGLWEVVMQLPRLLRIMTGIIEEIEKRQPDVVVTIDFPDFNFMLGKKLKKRGIFKGKLVHYVAPTVWAWRPGRAKKIAGFLDGLICLLPFEPSFFEQYGLKTEFIGHPISQENPLAGNSKKFKAKHKIPEDVHAVGLFFGSREEEIERHGRAIQETAIYLTERFDSLYFIVPTLQNFEYDIHNILTEVDRPKIFVIDQGAEKWDSFAAMDAAVAVSGTVGLELAYADVPHVTAYKTSWLNWLAIKALVKVKYAHLANIILDQPIVPEFLQQQCTSENMADEMEILLKGEDGKVEKQRAGFSKMRNFLDSDAQNSPSDRAAAFITSL